MISSGAISSAARRARSARSCLPHCRNARAVSMRKLALRSVTSIFPGPRSGDVDRRARVA